MQVEDIVELGGVRVTVWIFARVGICEGQSRVHLREEEVMIGEEAEVVVSAIVAVEVADLVVLLMKSTRKPRKSCLQEPPLESTSTSKFLFILFSLI